MKSKGKKNQEKARRYHDTFEAKQKLHKLMQRVIYATGNGEEDDLETVQKELFDKPIDKILNQ